MDEQAAFAQEPMFAKLMMRQRLDTDDDDDLSVPLDDEEKAAIAALSLAELPQLIKQSCPR